MRWDWLMLGGLRRLEQLSSSRLNYRERFDI